MGNRLEMEGLDSSNGLHWPSLTQRANVTDETSVGENHSYLDSESNCCPSAHEVLDAGAFFFSWTFSVGNNLGAISPEGLLLGIAFGPPLSKGSAFWMKTWHRWDIQKISRFPRGTHCFALAASFDRFAQDLQELLLHVAPFAGYSSGKEYFEHENPVLWLTAWEIHLPTIVFFFLNAQKVI